MTETSHLPPWRQRPIEQARLFNPAFISAILSRAVYGAIDEKLPGLIFAYSFLIPAFVLDQETRSRLPGTATTSFIAWCGSNADIIAYLPQRVIRTKAMVQESLRFSLQQNILSLQDSYLVAGSSPMKKTKKLGTLETDNILVHSQRLGRIFSRLESPVTLFSMLGVRP